MMALSKWTASSRPFRFLWKSGVEGVSEVANGMELVMTRPARVQPPLYLTWAMPARAEENSAAFVQPRPSVTLTTRTRSFRTSR